MVLYCNIILLNVILKEILSTILVRFSMFQCIFPQIFGPQNGFVLLLLENCCYVYNPGDHKEQVTLDEKSRD